MKKLLLASTALVLSAGLAHAQAVTITGQGRMGLQYNSVGFVGGSNWDLDNRLRLNFNVAVQGDHGLSFGAFSRVDIHDVATGQFSGARVWVEASGLRLTFGNQEGALVSTFVGGVFTPYSAATSAGPGGAAAGYNGLGGWLQIAGMHDFSSGGAGQDLVSISYTMGDTRVMVSHERGGMNETEIGVRSRFDAITVAAGYSTSGTWTISAAYNGGSWGVGAFYVDDAVSGGEDIILSGNVRLGGGTALAYVGRQDDQGVYGLGYSYGLGGGASFGIGIDRNTFWGTTSGQVGVAFNF